MDRTGPAMCRPVRVSSPTGSRDDIPCNGRTAKPPTSSCAITGMGRTVIPMPLPTKWRIDSNQLHSTTTCGSWPRARQAVSTYTGKAMAALVDLARAGQLRDYDTIVFLHTGGLPLLFVPKLKVL